MWNFIKFNIPEEEADILQADEEGNCLLPDNCLHLEQKDTRKHKSQKPH
jgi:hypothetical protein